ncbi:MAG TPA: hypothetical protein DD001_01890 [Microcoleaceae bacterium UBA10368]|nr:hypothetical protein [Microcoleaceae cyanobacterium UBA10368]
MGVVNNTEIHFSMIYGWVGAGFWDCLFPAIIVGEPAPTNTIFCSFFDSARVARNRVFLRIFRDCRGNRKKPGFFGY